MIYSLQEGRNEEEQQNDNNQDTKVKSALFKYTLIVCDNISRKSTVAEF